ncbi:MAG: SulP family inorganic anion transporter [Actinomycetota bacterium]|nr:SulP family inorganic anion transporter [Actinomycetota bacterium]
MGIPKPKSGDVLAGISVALLALPQGLAYSELAGLPAKYGLYAAALPSLLAALFVSSPYLQTGPVALTALLTFGALQGLAEPQSVEFIELAALLALMVGIIRLALGVFKFGKITNILTDSVVLGFTSGAAILIVFSQLPKSLGVQDVSGGVLSAGWESLTTPSQWEIGAILFSIFTILIIFGGRAAHRLFPGVLIAVVSGILISHFGEYSGQIVGELPGGFISLKVQYEWNAVTKLIFPAIVIAIVGFAEPASIARTFAKEENMNWSPNKEFISQGVANLAAAVSNAFPVGGSFGRSALNKIAGASTAWAGAVTGAFVLAALPFVFLLEDLPSAILGATVIGAVIKLIRIKDLLDTLKASTSEGVVAAGTLLATLLTSPRIERGILIGLIFALFEFLRNKYVSNKPKGNYS